MKVYGYLCVIVSLAAIGGPAAAAAGEDIGEAVAVIDYVTAAYDKDMRTLAAGDGVRQDELIEVGPKAKSEIKLNDDTKLALGPGSKLLLDKFVYDPGKTANAIIINMLEGTFRFITGVAQKPAYVIRTPSASITVRGTIFDVFVRPSGEAWVLLHEGGVKVCNDRGTCRVMDEPGRLMPVTEDGELGKPVRWASIKALGDGFFDKAFPFVTDVPSIDDKPVFTREALLEPESYTPSRTIRAPKKPARETVRTPPRIKVVTDLPPKKRKVIKVVEAKDDSEERYEIKKPIKPIRVVLPDRRRPKWPESGKERGNGEKYDRQKAETGKKAVRAALGIGLAIGASNWRQREYPVRTGSGLGGYNRMPGKSGLGGMAK